MVPVVVLFSMELDFLVLVETNVFFSQQRLGSEIILGVMKGRKVITGWFYLYHYTIVAVYCTKNWFHAVIAVIQCKRHKQFGLYNQWYKLSWYLFRLVNHLMTSEEPERNSANIESMPMILQTRQFFRKFKINQCIEICSHFW